MIELRTFDGSTEQLQAFVVASWRASYGGKMAFPLWTVPYFEWQFGLADGLPREHLVAAYDGSKLVGCVLGFPVRFRYGNEEFGATQGSWLSVDLEYRRQKIGSKLRQEMIRRHAEHHLAGQLGYIFQGSKLSLGNPFWTSKLIEGTTPLQRAGFWIRILHPWRAAAWNVNRLEAFGTRLTAPLYYVPGRSINGTVRAYRASDLPVCLELANEMSATTQWGIVWEETQLARHLSGGGVGKARVFEKDGQVRGVVSYHALPFLGRTEEVVGILDVIATQRLTMSEAATLIHDCIFDLNKAGAILVVKLASGDVPWQRMIRCGFFPQPAQSQIIFSPAEANSDLPIKKVSRSHVLWR
jgi:GNAT superfamily N-acetyltransferase